MNTHYSDIVVDAVEWWVTRWPHIAWSKHMCQESTNMEINLSRDLSLWLLTHSSELLQQSMTQRIVQSQNLMLDSFHSTRQSIVTVTALLRHHWERCHAFQLIVLKRSHLSNELDLFKHTRMLVLYSVSHVRYSTRILRFTDGGESPRHLYAIIRFYLLLGSRTIIGQYSPIQADSGQYNEKLRHGHAA